MQTILCFGLGLFIGSIALQILIWRLRPLQNELTRLLALFVALPAFVVSICIVTRAYSWLIPTSWASWCFVYLLDLSLSTGYMVLYTAITGFSPSIAILERVEESMPHGLPREELVPDWFTDQNLARARYDNLVSHRLISNSGGVLQLERRGRFIAQCFLIFRRFLGLPDLAKG